MIYFELPGFWMNPAELYVLLACEQLLENVQPGMISSRLAPLKDKIRHLLGESGWRYATQPTHFACFPWTGLPRPGWNIPHRSKEPSKKSTGLPTPASEFSAAAQKATAHLRFSSHAEVQHWRQNVCTTTGIRL